MNLTVKTSVKQLERAALSLCSDLVTCDENARKEVEDTISDILVSMENELCRYDDNSQEASELIPVIARIRSKRDDVLSTLQVLPVTDHTSYAIKQCMIKAAGVYTRFINKHAPKGSTIYLSMSCMSNASEGVTLMANNDSWEHPMTPDVHVFSHMSKEELA